MLLTSCLYVPPLFTSVTT